MIAEKELNKKDAIGVWDTNSVTVQATENSAVLAIEVPLVLN